MKSKITALDFILIGLSVLLTVGSVTFFRPCGVHEDGSFSTCHWAGMAVFGIGLALTAQSIIHIIMRRSGSKLGMSAAMIPLSLLSAIVPGGIINLCSMPSMRCLTTMRPAVIIVSLIITGVAIADCVIQANRSRAFQTA